MDDLRVKEHVVDTTEMANAWAGAVDDKRYYDEM